MHVPPALYVCVCVSLPEARSSFSCLQLRWVQRRVFPEQPEQHWPLLPFCWGLPREISAHRPPPDTRTHKNTYQSWVTQPASLDERDSLFSDALPSSRPAINQQSAGAARHGAKQTHPTENRPAPGTRLTDRLYRWSARYRVCGFLPVMAPHSFTCVRVS